MSGDQFLETLRDLGYEGAAKTDGKSFDWMFEDPVLAPFLEWFCDNIRQGNVLSPELLGK